MKDKLRGEGFRLPPHINAEFHRALMEKLETMTPEDFLPKLVKAGVCNPDGTYTASYAPGVVTPRPRTSWSGRRRPASDRVRATKRRCARNASTRRK